MKVSPIDRIAWPMRVSESRPDPPGQVDPFRDNNKPRHDLLWHARGVAWKHMLLLRCRATCEIPLRDRPLREAQQDARSFLVHRKIAMCVFRDRQTYGRTRQGNNMFTGSLMFPGRRPHAIHLALRGQEFLIVTCPTIRPIAFMEFTPWISINTALSGER